MKNIFYYKLLELIIYYALFFLIVIVPLLINPTAYDFWYKPKIESVYVLVLIIGVSWLIKAVVFDRSFKWQHPLFTLPFLLYALAAAIATLYSVDFRRSVYGEVLREEGFITIFSYLAMFFLISTQVVSRAQITTLLFGLVISTTLVASYGLFQYLWFNPTAHFFLPSTVGRVGSTMGNANFLGKYLVLTLPLVMSLCLWVDSLKSKMFLLGCIFIGSACLVVTFTRASWLSFLAGYLIFLLMIGRHRLLKQQRIPLLIVGIVLLLNVLLFNYCTFPGSEEAERASRSTRGKVMERVLSGRDVKKSEGIATRWFVWKKTLLLIETHPWWGYGPENFERAFKKFNLEYARTFGDYVIIDRAHNNYLDVAVSCGIAGLAAYLFILSTFFYYIVQLINSEDGKGRILLIGIFAGWCGYLVNDIFVFSVVSVAPTFWSLMGLAAAWGKFKS